MEGLAKVKLEAVDYEESGDHNGGHQKSMESTDDGNVREGGESVWFRCRHCGILLEDVMIFLFHYRLHGDSSHGSAPDIPPNSVELEKELGEAGVRIGCPSVSLQQLSPGDILHFSQLPELEPAPPPLSPLRNLPSTLPISAPALRALPGEEDESRVCKLCHPNPVFSTHTQFVDHLFQQHRVDREFRCSKKGCRYRTRSVQYIQTHMNHHPEPFSRFYTCHICRPKTSYFQSTKYARHMRTHLSRDGRYHCVDCSYSTSALQLFNKHTKKRHPSAEVPVRPPRSVSSLRRASFPLPLFEARTFTCNFCDIAWTSRKQYESHMILKHRNKEGKYPCSHPSCHYEAPTIRLIARHLKYKHFHSSPPPTKTRTTRSGTSKAETQTQNQRDELNEGKEEGNESGQDEHENNGEMEDDPMEEKEESGEGDEECPVCTQSLSVKDPTLLFDHIFQTHTRDNAVHCPLCTFRSTSLHTLLVHKKSVHASEGEISEPDPAPPALTPFFPPRLASSTTIALFSQRRQRLNAIRSGGRRGGRGGKKSYFCFYCDARGVPFLSVKVYSRHMRTLHMSSDGLYRCPMEKCGHVPATTLKRINEHMKRKGHFNSVSQVEKAAETRGPVLQQILLTEPPPKLPNDQEEKTEKEEDESSSKKWFQCKKCFILVPTKEKLFNHHQLAHPDSLSEKSTPPPTNREVGGGAESGDDDDAYPPPPVLSPNKKPPLQVPFFKCKFCYPPQWFHSDEKLQAHLSHSHQGEEEEAEGEAAGLSNGEGSRAPSSLFPPRRKMTCLFCLSVFTNQKIYISHMNSMHRDEEGLFKCPRCPHFTTQLLSKATKHIRRHGGSSYGGGVLPPLLLAEKEKEEGEGGRKPSLPPPPSGGKKRKRRRFLVKRNGVGGWKKLFCRLCTPPKFFERQRDYLRHAKETHARDGVYPCNRCPDAVFPVMSEVNRHMKIHHHVQ